MPERGSITDKELSAAMKKAREVGDYVQEDFAGPLGVSVSRISTWEASENEGAPSKGFKVLHYVAALLGRSTASRDAFLRAINAGEGLAPAEDPELQRRLDLVRQAYRARDSRLVRSALETLEAALEERAQEGRSDVPTLRVAERQEKYRGAEPAPSADAAEPGARLDVEEQP